MVSFGVAIRGGIANQANQVWSNPTTAGGQVLIVLRFLPDAPATANWLTTAE